MTTNDKIKSVGQAYADWRLAECKFKEWWNPDLRLSENPPNGAESAKKCVAFSRRFKEVFGVAPPNGFGQMTLRQMTRIAEGSEVRK